MTNQEQYNMICEKAEKFDNMTNRDWIDILSTQFDVSRTTARNMLHGLMKMKKYDNVRKLFKGMEVRK